MALQFECSNCYNIITAKFLKVGEEAECKNCFTKVVIPENVDNIDNDLVEVKKNVKIKKCKNCNIEYDSKTHTECPACKSVKDKEHQSTKTKNQNIKRFKDYPAMEMISWLFDILAKINVIVGIIMIFISIVSINDGIGLVLLGWILVTFIGWLTCKFFSESVIILCDMAYYLKSINEKKS